MQSYVIKPWCRCPVCPLRPSKAAGYFCDPDKTAASFSGVITVSRPHPKPEGQEREAEEGCSNERCHSLPLLVLTPSPLCVSQGEEASGRRYLQTGDQVRASTAERQSILPPISPTFLRALFVAFYRPSRPLYYTTHLDIHILYTNPPALFCSCRASCGRASCTSRAASRTSSSYTAATSTRKISNMRSRRACPTS